MNAIAILLWGCAAFLVMKERGADVVFALRTRITTWWSSWQRRWELREIERGFSDVLDHMAAGLRAGLSLHQACESVTVSSSGAAQRVFEGLVQQLQAGATIDEIFCDLAQRLPLDDVRIASQTIVILQASGGNLIEVFSKLAATMRERHRVHKKIQTATTQGKIQALILLFLPWGLAAILSCVSPAYVAPLWQTSLGLCALAIAIILEGMGAWFLWRIIRINV